MTFAWPHLLWLIAVPVALLAWEITHRRRAGTATRPKILRAEAGSRALKFSPAATSAPDRQARPRVWLCIGLVLAIVALARPQWGRLEEPVFDQAREILLAIDLSRSMLTPDVKPSRLERAKLLIQALLEKLQGERVGLVVFAGTAFLQSPLSADYEILREFLPALGPEFLPQGGSNYSALLETSLQAFGATNAADRFLVILSDGEATDENWKSQIAELKKKSIRVIGLGVGTTEGAMIPDGAGGLVKDERGAVVMSKLETSTLQELGTSTNGVYRDASAWVDLAALVNETIEAGRKGQFVEKNTIRLAERFQWPLAFAVWCLLVSFYYEFPVRPRVRDLRIGETTDRKPESGHKRANPVMTSGISESSSRAMLIPFLVLGVSCLQFPVSGFAAATLTHPPKQAPGKNATASAQPAEESSLAKIVGRLAGSAAPTGRDWAELARETVTWGSRLHSAKQPVAEGPVRDALAAVDLGSKLDAKTADWAKLREELEALLKKEDEEKKDDQQQDQQNQDQQQQQQQDQKQDQQKQNQQNRQQKDQQQQNDPNNKNDQSGESPEKKEQQQDGESAFGDMNQKDQPPPPESSPEENMQKVGGSEQQPQKQPTDPALALPLQKLDQLRNQDSPAQLFQLMEGDKQPQKKTTKDW